MKTGKCDTDSMSAISADDYFPGSSGEVADFISKLREDEENGEMSARSRKGWATDRGDLLETIKTIAEGLKVGERVYFLAIEYLDDVLSRLAFPKSRRQLAAMCCLYLAGMTLCSTLEASSQVRRLEDTYSPHRGASRVVSHSLHTARDPQL